MKATRALSLLAVVAGIALLAGCAGNFAPTLPSPGGGGVQPGQYQMTVTPGGAGLTPAELPDSLTAADFSVTIDGTPTTVISAQRVGSGTTRPLFICFIIDTTGSMSEEIAGIRNSIQAFADSFAGRPITWAGVEYGDATPLDGNNTWDFFGDPGVRTKFDPSTNLNAFKDWIATLEADGGGDGPENPLDPMMESKLAAPNGYGWSLPAGVDRHYVLVTDIGAHESSDGVGGPSPAPDPFCSYTGAQVLASFRGWAVVHCVSPDYSGSWPVPTAAASNNNGGPSTEVYTSGGWDVRELADGGPAASRTHTGTGGIWTRLPSNGNVDLNTLGITALTQESYVVTFAKPAGVTSGDVMIEAEWSGGSAEWDFPDFTF